jgi:hypothetical protein
MTQIDARHKPRDKTPLNATRDHVRTRLAFEEGRQRSVSSTPLRGSNPLSVRRTQCGQIERDDKTMTSDGDSGLNYEAFGNETARRRRDDGEPTATAARARRPSAS